MGQLDGKVAIVTGATSGIGERIAELFIAEGAKVVAAARRAEEGLVLAERCGEDLSFIRTDIANEADVEAMVNHAVTTFGKLDCLVNNAGVGSPMVGVANLTAEDFDRVFATNVRGAMLGIKYAAPIMTRLGSGSVISIASGAGNRGGASGHIYSAWESRTNSSVSLHSLGSGRARHTAKHDLARRHRHRHLCQIVWSGRSGGRSGDRSHFRPVLEPSADPARWPTRRHRKGGGLVGQRCGLVCHRSRPGRRRRNHAVLHAQLSGIPLSSGRRLGGG